MDLLTIIYTAVKVFGVLAIAVLVFSYVSYKFKTKDALQPHEKAADTSNELKMTVKDSKTNKEIVKGSISSIKPTTKTSEDKKIDSTHNSNAHHSSKERKPHNQESRQEHHTSSFSRHDSHKRREDPKRSESRGYEEKIRDEKRSRNFDRHSNNEQVEIKIPKPKKKIPNRDARIKILNKLNHTQDESTKIDPNKVVGKSNTTIESDFKKFYDSID